ncbi:MAG: acyltransferase [Gammaproteobacteria bacterium]|nr:MAG: acyltransferase [Gammaproteobacteria bacterium]
MNTLTENFKGTVCFLILLTNTLLLATLMIPLGVIKFLIPIKSLRISFTKMIINIGEIWISVNSVWVLKILNPNIQIQGFESLNKNEWYLTTSNHQSWADIFMVQMLTNRKIPMLKFFMKHVLIYVPVIGICWWALDMPFLKRYTKEQIKKNPALKGRDFKEMRKSLNHYSLHPVSVFSYAEGTRFTQKKHEAQDSPYTNLLKPKEGGMALALSVIPSIKFLIDITIIYESPKRSFWDYLCGRLKNIKIFVKKIEIPKEFLNERLAEDDGLRSNFKVWLNDIWKNKDDLISAESLK